MRTELARLTGETRAEIAERIRESQQHGEFSEDNSELDQVKTEQAFVENRIAELKSILSHAAELVPDNIPVDHVGIGSVVKIEDLEYGDTFEVRVVSSIEADPDKDYLSSESPMGTALFGGQPGETVSFEAPDGIKKFKIHAITR
ncbi:MAG: GreA/GreB family elongation factor [Armatimonadetes bacterium]|nr:GreA/GreB family elongation factor [Armatimonadota bacterium]MBS1728168.1 GreA/GreB family elongation factor [Armatimonadota bacterium]